MTCNTPLRPLLRLDKQSEGPFPINRLVMSSLSTYMMAPTLLPLWQAPTFFIIWVLEGRGWGSLFPVKDVKPLLPGPLWPGVVVPVRVLSMGLIGKYFYEKIEYPLRMNLFQNFVGIKYFFTNRSIRHKITQQGLLCCKIQPTLALSAGALKCTDCTSAEG